MTRHLTESQELDHVTILAMRVAAAAKPEDPVEFVRQVCRLIDVAVAEAEERWEQEQRVEHVGPDRPIVIQQVDYENRYRCPYCDGLFLDGREHWCASFELMLRRSCVAQLSTADGALAVVKHLVREIVASSTGAAAERNADQQTVLDAAGDTPAAPPSDHELERFDGESPAHTDATPQPREGESPGAALSSVSRPYSADNGHSKTVAAHETPRARGKQRTFDHDQARADYAAARELALAEGRKRLPNDTLQNIADKHGCSVTTLKKVLYQPNEHEGALPHTHSHACWCRKHANAGATRWCTNVAAKPNGPIKTLAGQQEGPSYRRPRN